MKIRGILKEHPTAISIGMRLGDVSLIALSGIGAYALRLGQWPMPAQYQIALYIAGLLTFLAFPGFGIYRSWRGGGLGYELRQLTLAWGTIVTLLIVLAFVTKTGAVYSRLWLAAWVLVAWGGLLAFHASLRAFLRWVREKGFNSRRIVIVGAGQLGRNVARHIQEVPWTGFKAVAFYDDDTYLHGQILDGVKVKGAPSRLAKLLKKHYIDEVWLALPLRAEQRVKEILAELRHSTVNVRFVPDIFGFRLLNHGVSEVAGIPVLDLNRSPMVGVNRVIKAFEDRLLAAIILLLASPLMIFIALGIKLTSRGPVFFKQLRHGWDGKQIIIYKFRTMKLHQEAKGCVTQACRNDLRVTKFGSFLRRTSMDELPQFINVLQGRMSIVGPRPHAMEHNNQYKDLIEAYMQRHKVKPGITGWAQINGWRGETDTVEKMQKRVEFDLYYIENWSIWFDLKIIVLTFFKGLVHANAY